MLGFSEFLKKSFDADPCKNENSMNKFVENFSRDASQFGFSTAEIPLHRFNALKTAEQNGFNESIVRRSSLTLNGNPRKRSNDMTTLEPRKIMNNVKGNTSNNTKFNLLPVPNMKNFPKVHKPSTSKIEVSHEKPNSKNDVNQQTNSTSDPYRNLALITGNVEFVIRMNKVYGSSDLIYEVYAKVIRITIGKYPFEKVVLLRNESGPVLQAAFYEIDQQMPTLILGGDVRCVGKFKGSSRIQLFKITMLDLSPSEESLIRLQNLCNFTMNKIKNNDQ